MSVEKTLRDEFAMAALVGRLSGECYSKEMHAALWKDCWEHADGMLAECQKSGPACPDPIKAMHERAYPLAGPFAPPFEARLAERDFGVQQAEIEALKTENAKLRQELADQSASIEYAKLALTDLRGAVKSQPKSS